MASGMGMPAIGIYSHELFNGYGVENIIRVGSAGAIQENIHLYDLVIAQGACTDSNFAAQFHLPGTFAPHRIMGAAEGGRQGRRGKRRRLPCGQREFLRRVLRRPRAGARGTGQPVRPEEDGRHGAGNGSRRPRYMNAARYGKRALCICTISDHILTGEDTTSEQRQNSFTTMMKVALDTAVAMENK